MKLQSTLKSNHDLKKNGYRILSKLHKMETSKGIQKAYASAHNGTYFFALNVRALVEIIKKEYPEERLFHERCNSFLTYLDAIASRRARLNPSVLASFLHAYTTFFNYIIETHHSFCFDAQIRNMWNKDCLMSYIATWGNNR